MIEIKVSIEAAELAAAINRLATAFEAKGVATAPTVADDKPTPARKKAEAKKQEAPATEPQKPAEVKKPEAPTETPVKPAEPTEVTSQPAEPVKPTELVKPAEPETPAKPAEPMYTLQTISAAAAPLLEQGKMMQLLELLKKHGVAAVSQLKVDQLDAFAADLIALGAKFE